MTTTTMTRSNDDDGGERAVLVLAAASRLVATLLAVATALIVVPYDTSAPAPQVPAAVAAMANWDGVYFAHIAEYGYSYEHFHAFFPLFPLLARAGSKLLPLEDTTSIIVAGCCISNLSFILAALYLYRLGRLVLPHEPTARRAAYLFCIAPSSVFMSAMYSESLTCLLSFAGMFHLETSRVGTHKRAVPLLTAACLFGLASITRSNGILLSLYIAWYRLCASPWPTTTLSGLVQFLRYWVFTAFLGVVAIGPQLVYFAQAAATYCPSLTRSITAALLRITANTSQHHAITGADATTTEMGDRPWCLHVVPNFSAMYMFIQREYWNVGLLRYYEWKQVPNFLRASPMLLLSSTSLVVYFFVSTRRRPTHQAIADAGVAPYYVHWAFLLVNALLVVHIPTTTRLLAACPPVFWAPAAHLMTTAKAGGLSGQGKLVVAYFALYFVLGATLFPSFYPWT